MSIIRLSVLKDGIYAPDRDGNLVAEPFSGNRGQGRRGVGRMERYLAPMLPRPGDALERYLERSLAIEAAELAPGQPIVVLIHGFLFDPAMTVVRPPHHSAADNPHARLYHFEEHPQELEIRHHSTGWPRQLGFQADDAGRSGLTIAFGWNSSPGFFSSLFRSGKNFYEKAYDFADEAAWALVAVLDIVTRVLPGRKIDLFAHSLGSRVAIRALAKSAQPGETLAAAPPRAPVIEAIDRVFLLAGAEYVFEAQLMKARLNAAAGEGMLRRAPEFWNFVSRENDVLDVLAENFGPTPTGGSKQVIGHNGLERVEPDWLDVQLDSQRVIDWFRGRGHRLMGDERGGIGAVLDHWIHYTWRGNMALYREMIRSRGDWTIREMRAAAPDLFNRPVRLRGASVSGIDGGIA